MVNVLVVGAGAVGQVYGRHAQLAGAHVTFFVREKYREEVSRGFAMYPLNRRHKTTPVRFEGFEVVTTSEQVRARTFDQVYLTVSSSALAGSWLGELIAATGTATILALQPGPDDLATILSAGAPRERVASGVITLISYHAPLPGETRFPSPGTAYWFPPLAPSQISGDQAKPIVALLAAGGLPTKLHANVPAFAVFPNAMLMPYLVALESAGWKFDALNGERIALGARGAREAFGVVSITAGKPPFGARLLARPRVLKIALWFGRRIVPLPLETYLREHFTKVGEQTRMLMAAYISKGRAASLEISGLEKLMAELPAVARG